MSLAEFKTLYWHAIATTPSFPPTASLLSRARNLASILRYTPAGFTHQLVRIIVLSARLQGLELNESATLQDCYSQLLKELPVDGEFLLSDAPAEASLTEMTLKAVIVVRLAWRLLFNSQ